MCVAYALWDATTKIVNAYKFYVDGIRDVCTGATDVTAVAPKFIDKNLNPIPTRGQILSNIGAVAPKFYTSCVVSSKLEVPTGERYL